MNYINRNIGTKLVLETLRGYWRRLKGFIREHGNVFQFVVCVVLPIILKTGSRPILFYRYVGIGDILCSFPAVDRLKQRHPNRVYIYSCYPEFRCLPKMAGVASIIVSVRVEIIESYWSYLFEEIFTFWHDDEPGYSKIKKVLNEVSVIEDFGRQHDIEISDSHPHLQIETKILDRVRILLERRDATEKPLIVIHTGPSWKVREFPEKSWTTLIQQLHAQGFTNIVQLGTSDHSCLGAVGSMMFPEVVSYVDQLSLEESIALISMAQLFIGIDSGLLHVAASLRTPGIGIFGATSPKYRFSNSGSCKFVFSEIECQGCHHRLPRLHFESGCPFNIACMDNLSTEKVLAMCLLQLKSQN